ncbi:unnamed protein product [Blepharisma stoltei]|uniref:Uncharacterized protein n=1 Tax=Blepharisma stoltei TaxID=1481888 RepID=A0AAU9K438_9CILI|nr:unnamed protein product [Blepharisma stoltei]
MISKTCNSFFNDLITFLHSRSENFRERTYFLLDISQIHCSLLSLNLYHHQLCASIIFNAPYTPQFAFVERVISFIKRKFKSIQEGLILNKLEISINYAAGMINMKALMKSIVEKYSILALRGQDLGD